ncbi:MAG TPA: hypothetical protein VHZ51_29540 [Ktedonobacteraceae bacterium]|jgi:hypothetical protein|nr:hypothetical protein [Ktedonobacteraceae bacterium]
MDKHYATSKRQALESCTGESSKKGNTDRAVFRYMTQKVHVMMYAFDTLVSMSQPSVSYLEERRGRTHRIAIYNALALMQSQDLSFVGFVSKKRKLIDPLMENELWKVDKLLLTELPNIPGLLGYCSLELRSGCWYNLVLLSHLDAKAHFKELGTHSYAAYQLAPAYYEWIRLHSGTLPGGLAGNTFVLHSTKYYTFVGVGQGISMQERIY